jgi:ATP-binding cassette, subfamily A (ABC1), member 5
LVAFRLVIPIYMVMALSQFITYLLILIVGEKEKHIKEGLKIVLDLIIRRSTFLTYLFTFFRWAYETLFFGLVGLLFMARL